MLSSVSEAVMLFFLFIHWHESFTLQTLSLVLLQFLSITGWLSWLRARKRIRIDREKEWRKIWENCRKSLAMRFVMGFHKTSTQALLVCLSSFFLYMSFSCLSITTSIVLSDFKQYELAERLFKFAIWPINRGDMTLIGLMDGIGSEDKSTEYDIEINKTINEIYGRSSPQAAHRRCLLGERFRSCAARNFLDGDDSKALEQYSSSWFWFENALEDHRRLSKQFEVVFDLSNIAYCTARLGARKEALDALREADLIISHLYDSEELRSVKDRLDLAAKILDVKPHHYSALPDSRSNGIIDASTIAVLLPAVVWYSMFLFGCRKICCLLNIRTLNQLLISRKLNFEDRLSAFCELSSNYLYLKNFDKAEETSIKLLRLAESRE